jgi:hypothetical protein
MVDRNDMRDMTVTQHVAREWRRHGLTICDGAGGTLALKRVLPELLWLASACRTLISGRHLAGGDLLKVSAGDEVYLVSHQRAEGGEPAIQIANLYSPDQCVVMPYDLAQLVAGLLEEMVAS